jgi:electron transfer flavoprotein beta subunit
MRIIVCAKHVADSTEIRYDETSAQPVLNNVPTKISDYDRNALEAAVTIKEQHADCKVEVLMVGGAAAQKTLKEAVAMGADLGYLVEGGWEDPFNPLISARVLTRAIEEMGVPDMVFCGAYSEDGYSGVTGAAIAELLGLPYLGPVTAIDLTEEGLVGRLPQPGVAWSVGAQFPCVLGIDSAMNVPRLPTVLQTMKVKGDRLRSLSLADVGLVAANLHADLPGLRLEHFMSGAVQRKGVRLEGSPQEMVSELMARLAEEGVLA